MSGTRLLLQSAGASRGVSEVAQPASGMCAYPIASEQRLEWFLIQPGQPEVTNFDLTCAVYEDVGWLEVAVDDPIVM